MTISLTGNMSLCNGLLSSDISLLDFFCWGMAKETDMQQSSSDMDHLKEHISNECAQIDGDIALLYSVHLNIAKWIVFCITNVENHEENVIHEFC